MKIVLLNFVVCVLNILANHILLTRKKPVWFCVAAFILNTLFIFSINYLVSGYIKSPMVLEYVYTLSFFSYIAYIYFVFSESLSKKIFTLFSISIFSFISFFVAVQVSVLFPELIADKYIFEFIWLLRFGIELTLMTVLYFCWGKLYKGVISLVPDRIINLMSFYPILAFLLLKTASFTNLDNSRSVFIVPILIAFIVVGYLVTFAAISASSKVELQRYMANYDSVTGIANRANIMSQLAGTMESSKRKKQRFALFVCDLDNFKSINDEYGHITGDKALRYSAQAVQRVLCKTDVVGRFGGDEFLIIQNSIVEERDTETLISRIFEEFEKPFESDGISIHLNLSIGVSIFPDNTSDMEALIYKADSAMYEAKKREGCSFCYFEKNNCRVHYSQV